MLFSSSENQVGIKHLTVLRNPLSYSQKIETTARSKVPKKDERTAKTFELLKITLSLTNPIHKQSECCSAVVHFSSRSNSMKNFRPKNVPCLVHLLFGIILHSTIILYFIYEHNSPLLVEDIVFLKMNNIKGVTDDLSFLSCQSSLGPN